MRHTLLLQCLCPSQHTLPYPGVTIVGTFPSTHIMEPSPPPPLTTLPDAFSCLPDSLQHICGDITLPSDNGEAIIDAISSRDNVLFGASDASLKDGRVTHAWILSSGNIDDIADENLHLSGRGPVDGYYHNMSSGWVELHDTTTISIMPRLFLTFHSS